MNHTRAAGSTEPKHAVPFFLHAIVILVGVSITLRLTVNNVAPVIPVIRESLGLSESEAGLLGSLPLIVFGIFAFATPAVVRRFGAPVTIVILLTIVAAGTAIRFIPTTPALMGGTILLSVGVGMGNAVVPVAIRTFYPRRATAYMGWFSVGLNVGASMGAAATVPLMQQWGLSWNAAISVWVVVIVLVLVWWLIGWGLAKKRDSPMFRREENSSVAGVGAMFRNPTLLAITAHMGVQSAMFFAIMTWGPVWFQEAGATDAESGAVIGAYALSAIPGALLGPKLLEFSRWRVILVAYGILFMPAVVVMGFFGFGSSTLGWAATLLAGLCSGAHLAMSLALIVGYPDGTKVAGLSALANGLGFILASIWPVGLGLIAEQLGGWSVPIIVVALMPVITLGITFAINQRFQSEREELVRLQPHL